MKTNIELFFLAVFTLVLTSCSADYDYTIDLDANNLSFISLQTNFDHTTVGLNQTLTFAVIDDYSGENYTPIATIFVDGVALAGNTFTFEEAGEYTFMARVNDLVTNTLTIQVVATRFVTVSQDKMLRGQEVEFQFYNTNGENITNTATFIVNGSIISGNTYSSSQAGTFDVRAQYGGTGISPPTTFEVYIPRRKVSYEDYTGTWCGWCPRVTTAVRKLKEQSNYVVAVAIHNNDVMVRSAARELQLRQEFSVAGFPAARLNRTIVVPTPEDQPAAITFVLDQAGTPTDFSIAIDTKLSGDLLNVKTRIISENGLPSGHKLVVYLYQDGLVFPQVNYYVGIATSPWYGLGNPIPEFIHDDVFEIALTDILGDALPQIGAHQVHETSFEPINLSTYGFTTGGNVYDPTKFGIAVYVVDQNNETKNAQHVKAGKSIEFE